MRDRMQKSMERRWRRLSFYRSLPVVTRVINTPQKLDNTDGIPKPENSRGSVMSTISNRTTATYSTQSKTRAQPDYMRQSVSRSAIHTVSRSLKPSLVLGAQNPMQLDAWVPLSIQEHLPPRPNIDPGQVEFWCTYCASSQFVAVAAKDTKIWQ
jgi:hypothetical protein